MNNFWTEQAGGHHPVNNFDLELARNTFSALETQARVLTNEIGQLLEPIAQPVVKIFTSIGENVGAAVGIGAKFLRNSRMGNTIPLFTALLPMFGGSPHLEATMQGRVFDALAHKIRDPEKTLVWNGDELRIGDRGSYLLGDAPESIVGDTNASTEGAADIVEPHAAVFQSEADISWGDHFGNPNFDRVDYVDHGQNILTDRMFEIAAFSMADAGVNIDPTTMSSIMFVDTVSARSSSRDGRVLNRALMGKNGSILIGTDDAGQSYAIFGSDAENRNVGVNLQTSSYNVVKIYRGDGNDGNVLGYKNSGGGLVPLVTVTKEGGLEVMVPITGGEFEATAVAGKPQFSPVQFRSESELNPVFSLESWAGTDQSRLNFVNTLDALGYPRDNVTCDAEGACFDLDGNVIARNGVFLLQFAKDAAIEYGNPKPTIYGPKKGNVAPGTQTGDVTTFVTVPLLRGAREMNKLKSLGFDLGEGNEGVFKTYMLSEEDKSWSIEYFRDHKDPNAPRYFIFENINNDIIIVPVS